MHLFPMFISLATPAGALASFIPVLVLILNKRIRYGAQRIVILRDDIAAKMRRNALFKTTDDESVELSEHVRVAFNLDYADGRLDSARQDLSRSKSSLPPSNSRAAYLLGTRSGVPDLMRNTRANSLSLGSLAVPNP